MYSVWLSHASGLNTDMTNTYANTEIYLTYKKIKCVMEMGNLQMLLGLAPHLHIFAFFREFLPL